MSEENSLDDFFAKKDKVKKKTTKSRITPDDIGQMLEKKLTKGPKKGSKVKQKEGNEQDSHALEVKVEEDDGEWKEVEIEAEKDYSGLRIQSLNMNSKNGMDQDSNGNPQSGDESAEKKDAQQGPWKAISAPMVESDPEPEPQPVAVEAPKTGKYVPPGARQSSQIQPAPQPASTDKPAPGKYVPPALRHKQGAQPGTTAKFSYKNKKAPDVSSVEDFPSLKAAAIIEQGGGFAQDFEKVRGGAKPIENPLNTTAKISLDNKYGALQES